MAAIDPTDLLPIDFARIADLAEVASDRSWDFIEAIRKLPVQKEGSEPAQQPSTTVPEKDRLRFIEHDVYKLSHESDKHLSTSLLPLAFARNSLTMFLTRPPSRPRPAAGHLASTTSRGPGTVHGTSLILISVPGPWNRAARMRLIVTSAHPGAALARG
jgi:hypothetical protein